MESLVKDLTVPIAKFPRISDTATFSGAVMALERAQEEYLSGKREQRILLVTDSENKVVGKLSPLDVVRGLEPDYETLVDQNASSRVENFDYVIQPPGLHIAARTAPKPPVERARIPLRHRTKPQRIVPSMRRSMYLPMHRAQGQRACR